MSDFDYVDNFAPHILALVEVYFYFFTLQDFLESLCAAAEKRLDEPSTKVTLVMRSFLTSLGQIKFRPKKLLDKISDKMMEHESELQNKDLITFLVTMATLNYVPQNSDKLYEVMLKLMILNSDLS